MSFGSLALLFLSIAFKLPLWYSCPPDVFDALRTQINALKSNVFTKYAHLHSQYDTILVACIYLINKIIAMLRVTKQVDVVCSAISIKEAMIMCPITSWICHAIKQKSSVNIDSSAEQCKKIGKVLGELGFVNEMGENPLELIQDRNVEELEQDIAAQCPE